MVPGRMFATPQSGANKIDNTKGTIFIDFKISVTRCAYLSVRQAHHETVNQVIHLIQAQLQSYFLHIYQATRLVPKAHEVYSPWLCTHDFL